MTGPSLNFFGGAGGAYAVDLPLAGGPNATEKGLSSFQASVALSYVWRLGDLARQMVGTFGVPYRYR